MFIAYIYDGSNNPIAQVEEILDLNITMKLNAVSSASFWLYHTNEYCKRQYLQEYRRIRVTELANNEEKTMFDGVIRWFDADIDKTEIKMESFEHLCERRLLHSNYSFSWQTIQNILQTILNDINTRSQTNITLDCGISTTTSKEYKKGDTFLSVLQDLADNGFEFWFDGLVLKFKETIWIDRTSIGDDFVEYRFDVTEPEDRSIDKIKMAVDWKELATGVIWKSWSNFTELDDPTQIAKFWLIETSFSNSWDQANATQAYLDDHKESLSEFDVDAVTQNFFEANVWDLVAVYIYVWNDIMFFDWSMKVVEKKYTSKDLPQIAIWLSKTKAKSKDLIEQISEIQKRMKILEFRQ